MPNFSFKCYDCVETFEFFCPIAERDKVSPSCPNCKSSCDVERIFAAPAVMNASYPDGNRRFDNIRRFRALEDAKRRETDKTQKAKLVKEMNRITGKAD